MTLNFRNMKKILYSVAIAAIMMTSCQKTDVLNVVEDPIEFGTAVGKLTKAGEATGDLTTLKKQGFRVWVVADFDSPSSTAGASVEDGKIYNGMNGLDVMFNTAWGFANGGKYMWPQKEQALYFYTISSAKTSWLETIKSKNYFVEPNVSKTSSVAELKLDEYMVDPTAHDDIMVADKILQHKSMASLKDPKVVSPTFKHTMTKVEFNFVKGVPNVNNASVATTVILKEIKTSELTDNGNLKITYSAPAAGETEAKEFGCEWVPAETPTSKAFTGTPKTVITIAKDNGAIITSAVNTENAPTGENQYIVVYTETGENDNKVITSATIYKSKGTVVDESTTWSWEEVEIHSYANNAWPTKVTNDKFETLFGFELRTAAEIQEATNNEDAKYDNFVTWYMIPQLLESASLTSDDEDNDERLDTEGAVVTISYIADGKHITQNFDLNVSANEEDQDWVESTCVKYNVTITPHKIVFKPYVTDWDTDHNDNGKDDDDVNMNN